MTNLFFPQTNGERTTFFLSVTVLSAGDTRIEHAGKTLCLGIHILIAKAVEKSLIYPETKILKF